MVSPALIVPPEPILALNAANATPGYPSSNLLRDDPQLSFVSAGYTSLSFETAGAPMDTFAILDTTASESATIGVTGGNTLAEVAGGNPQYAFSAAKFRASSNLPQRPGYHSLIRLPAPQAYRFWRIDCAFGDGDARQNQFQARYLVAGLARTAKNISADRIEAPLDLGSIDRNRAGGPDRVWGHKMRKIDFEISVMREMQWETQFADLWRKIGLSEPVLVVPNSRNNAFLHDRILFGTVAASRNTMVNSPLYTQAFSVESLI